MTEDSVPFVAIGAGEKAPWEDLPLTCPECGQENLPLEDRVSSGGSIVMSFIPHCGQTLLRGPIRDRRADGIG